MLLLLLLLAEHVSEEVELASHQLQAREEEERQCKVSMHSFSDFKGIF